MAPQLIGRGEIDREECSLRAEPAQVRSAVMETAASDPRLKLDSLDENQGRLQYITRGGFWGWGERIVFSIREERDSGEPGGASDNGYLGHTRTRLIVEVQGRQRNGFLQPQRNHLLARRFVNAVRQSISSRRA